MILKYRNNIFSAISGVLTGFVLKNIFLAAVLGFCFFYIPFYQAELKRVRDAKKLSGSLQHSLNLITGSYIQSEDITAAIRENINRTEEPIKEVLEQFLAETSYVDANIVNCIKRMKSRLKNKFYESWCDTLIQCQYDRDLKYILASHIEKMADVKKIQDELDTRMIEVYRDFSSVAATAFMSYPMMFFLNREWFNILSSTNPGRILVALTYLTIFLSIAYAIKVNKPITIN